MKWSVFELQKYQNKDFPINEVVNVSDVRKKDETIRNISPIRVKGQAYIDSDKITFHLNIKGELTLPCSRTLVDVNYPIDVDTIETFLLKEQFEDVEPDGEIHKVTGGMIDLNPILQEIVLLEVPMQVFSNEAAKGEGAPQSGMDWQVIQEKDLKNRIDPRWEKLGKLFKQDDLPND